MSDDNHKGPVDRALDVFVYAPLGIALLARDSVPGLLQAFAVRGRAEIESRRREAESKVGQAKAVGRFAVDYGAPVVRKRVEDRLTEARDRAEQTFSGLVVGRDDRSATMPTAAEPPPPAPPTRPATSAPPAAGTGGARPPHAAPAPAYSEPQGHAVNGDDVSRPSLSIPDYDELSASQVVQRLPGLSVEELEAIRAYETRGRGRRTILGKIDQLAR